jgi:hypothetical protein
MPHRLIEPATWFAQPSSEGLPFDTVARAVVYAMTLPLDDRHRLATIVTKHGSIYGWDAIEEMSRRL